MADELSDPFLDELCAAAREEKPDVAVIGEVWEDASNKIAYGRRRRYLLGGQLAAVSRVIYALVGLAGLWCITLLFRERDGEE